jgi:hypothetical protein
MTSIAARTDTAEQRSAIFARLVQRNRLVNILRFGLPALGSIILAALILQIYAASLVPGFGFANVTIDRGNLSVESPNYSGVGPDGSVYELTAATAKAALGNTDLINLTGAAFKVTQPGGTTFDASAEAAQLTLSSQVVVVPLGLRIGGTNGLDGTVQDAVIDISANRLTGRGPASFFFAGGTTLQSGTMSYDGKTRTWRFENGVTLNLSQTPGEEGYAEAKAAAALQLPDLKPALQ